MPRSRCPPGSGNVEAARRAQKSCRSRSRGPSRSSRRHEGVEDPVHLGLRKAHQGTVQVAEQAAPGAGVAAGASHLRAESRRQVRELGCFLEDDHDVLEGSEPVQHPELAERRVHFRLVVVVAVGALRGVEGDAGRVLAREAGPGLGERGVGLQREHGACIEHLEEVGQPAAESPGVRLAEDDLGRGGDQRVHPDGYSVEDDHGRGARMRAEPQLGEGARLQVAPADQAGDELPTSPCIVLHGSLERCESRVGDEVADGDAGVAHVPASCGRVASSSSGPEPATGPGSPGRDGYPRRAPILRTFEPWRASAWDHAAGNTRPGPAWSTPGPRASITSPSTHGSTRRSRWTSGSGR